MGEAQSGEAGANFSASRTRAMCAQDAMFDSRLEQSREDEGAVRALAPDLVAALLDHVPQAAFWIKDRVHRYVSVNTAMLELCGARSPAEMIGRSAQDFFPQAVREREEKQDRQVLHTKRPGLDQLELCAPFRGQAVWLLTKRRPLLDTSGEIGGVVAIARKLPADRYHAFERLAFVIDHIHANYRSPVDICGLARRCRVSVSQLNRDFAGLMGSPPKRYLMKLRFEAALELLERGLPVVEVAHACGYSDQSAFARSFRQNVGVSPSAYRRAQAAQ
jgi:PAS domain S-box-containing protein